MGKKMKDWLKFAMHGGTHCVPKGATSSGAAPRNSHGMFSADPLQNAKDKADAGFEIMSKLGVDVFLFP